jgi:hypothetical protein
MSLTVTKEFTHYGHTYKRGDTFIAQDPSEVDALVRQGYAQDPNQTPQSQ